MSIVTDDTPLEDPKNPDTCNVYALMKYFASKERLDDIAGKYRAGGYGYGHAKLELLDILLEYFGPARARYAELMEDYSLIEERLTEGNALAEGIQNTKYQQMKNIIGLS